MTKVYPKTIIALYHKIIFICIIELSYANAFPYNRLCKFLSEFFFYHFASFLAKNWFRMEISFSKPWSHFSNSVCTLLSSSPSFL
jgi:hypothetical protein